MIGKAKGNTADAPLLAVRESRTFVPAELSVLYAFAAAGRSTFRAACNWCL
jgi:hypothetical protein